MPFGRPLQTYRGKQSKDQRADEQDWYHQSNKHVVAESGDTAQMPDAKHPLSTVHRCALSPPP